VLRRRALVPSAARPGSENFSNTSLNRNRQLGLITSDHKVMSSIAKTFAADFRNGKHWS
jgi:phosphatidylserine/phosphatidylglycerophosphate/cardiolipin synthase-like enzyme